MRMTGRSRARAAGTWWHRAESRNSRCWSPDRSGGWMWTARSGPACPLGQLFRRLPVPGADPDPARLPAVLRSADLALVSRRQRRRWSFRQHGAAASIRDFLVGLQAAVESTARPGSDSADQGRLRHRMVCLPAAPALAPAPARRLIGTARPILSPGTQWWNGSILQWDGATWHSIGPSAAAGPVPTTTIRSR